MRTLIQFCEVSYTSIIPMGNRGNGYIRTKIDGLNKSSDNIHFFVLTDLDAGDCAPNLIRSWLSGDLPPVFANLID